jgi:hemoglobin-like flavoprotein
MQQYCRDENLDFNLLKPLILETVTRIETTAPENAQTGPAIRHDTTTITKHLELLQQHPQLKAFYNLFTQSIGQQADL